VGPKFLVTSRTRPWAYGLVCASFGFSLRDRSHSAWFVYDFDRFCTAAGVRVDPRCCLPNGPCCSASSCTHAAPTCDECDHLAKSETCGRHVPVCRRPRPGLIRVPPLAALFRHPSDKSSSFCERTSSGSCTLPTWSRDQLSHVLSLVLELALFSVRSSTGDSPDPHPRSMTRAKRRTPEASSSSRWSCGQHQRWRVAYSANGAYNLECPGSPRCLTTGVDAGTCPHRKIQGKRDVT